MIIGTSHNYNVGDNEPLNVVLEEHGRNVIDFKRLILVIQSTTTILQLKVGNTS